MRTHSTTLGGENLWWAKFDQFPETPEIPLEPPLHNVETMPQSPAPSTGRVGYKVTQVPKIAYII